jgi:hypothetical protein
MDWFIARPPFDRRVISRFGNGVKQDRRQQKKCR